MFAQISNVYKKQICSPAIYWLPQDSLSTKCKHIICHVTEGLPNRKGGSLCNGLKWVKECRICFSESIYRWTTNTGLPSLISVLLWGVTAYGTVEVDQQSFDFFSKKEITLLKKYD